MDANQSSQNEDPHSYPFAQLAIETTGQSGSVAVLRGSQAIREQKLDTGTRTASSLAPAIEEIFTWCRDSGIELDFVSVASGPGSFTGLRIGVTTAKTLCYATKISLVAVDSLSAIAAAAFAQDSQLAAVTVGLNAYRGQVFTGDYERDRFTVAESRIVDSEEWDQILASLPEDRVVTGDEKVFPNFKTYLQREQADAVGVGLVALQKAIEGDWSDPMQLVPKYLKPSAAEEQAAK